ncbi:MAG TPA: azurin [Cytophagales bacterium]|nr:azurin [Cytophagales bacterium]
MSLFISVRLGLMALASLCLVSCGGGSQEEKPPTVTIEGDLVKVVVNSNDQMQFDTNEIRVPVGKTIELTLHHTGQMPVEAMGHNVVILKPGTVINDFVSKAMAAAGNDYIPREGDEVVVNTAMIGGGESTTVTFASPAAGTYDFICSFPGHYGLMKGKFIVE